MNGSAPIAQLSLISAYRGGLGLDSLTCRLLPSPAQPLTNGPVNGLCTAPKMRGSRSAYAIAALTMPLSRSPLIVFARARAAQLLCVERRRIATMARARITSASGVYRVCRATTAYVASRGLSRSASTTASLPDPALQPMDEPVPCHAAA